MQVVGLLNNKHRKNKTVDVLREIKIIKSKIHMEGPGGFLVGLSRTGQLFLVFLMHCLLVCFF